MRTTDYHDAQAAAMSEDQLLSAVLTIARQMNILAYHVRDSRRSEAGWPDLVLVGHGGVLYRELKRQDGRLTPAQQTWLYRIRLAGQDAGVWRPTDLVRGIVLDEMRGVA